MSSLTTKLHQQVQDYRSQDWMYLHVWKTNQHLYTQILHPLSGQVILSLSTLDPVIRLQLTHGNTLEAARLLGVEFAKMAQEAGFLHFKIWKTEKNQTRFYHGRLEAFLHSLSPLFLE
uniref:Ribosomal protein L18 n=1 Tax=Andalucia godoyi TaxID=505711 RepID=M4QKJ0_ANDGO|nr:ribosomal protein L18 [Andalucia godoyi]AGH23988.1 ribosomal protein L18 [Andalucia godoyi]